MNKTTRRAILMLVVILALVVPTTVMANKKIYKASISAANELHVVTNPYAKGAGVFNSNPDGTIHFQVQIRNLSGPVLSMHLHAPATASQTAGVVVTLCGTPAPAAAGACPPLDSNNSLLISGNFNSSHFAQSGITGAEFQSYLDGGLVYVNAHTDANPAGEARGQLIPQ